MIVSDIVGSCGMMPEAGQFWWKTYDWNTTHEIQFFHHFILWNVRGSFNLILRATFGFSNQIDRIKFGQQGCPHMDCKMLYMASHPTNHLGRQIIASRRLLHIPGVDRVISEASTVWHMSKDQRLGTKRTFFNRKPNCLFQDMQHHSVVWYSVDISSESVRLLQTNRCLPKHNLFTLPKSLILILKPRALPNTFPTKYTYVYIYIFHYIPRKFRQLSHFLSVSSYLISKAPTMDPAIPPHRPWPPTGSFGTCQKWMLLRKMERPFRAEIKGSLLKRGHVP